MQSFSRYLLPGALVVFAIVCVYGLRADLAAISLAPLARSWDLVVLATACSLLNYGLRIVRWRGYLARLGCSLPFTFTALTYIAGFAFTVSPGKVGEMARARYYSRFGMSLSDVAGAFFVERLMDVVAMIVLASLIVTAAPRYQLAIWGAAGGAAVTLLLLGSLPWAAVANRLGSHTHRHLVTRLAASVARALAAARSLLRPGTLLPGFILGLVAWGLEGLGMYALGSAFPAAHLVATTAIGIYAIGILVGAISFLPGGLGSTEAVMTALLATQGYSVGHALLVTIACRVVTLWFAVASGWIAIAVLRQQRTVAVVS